MNYVTGRRRGRRATGFDEHVVGQVWFRRDWLDRHGLDHRSCAVIKVRGESMEPTLPDGCSILVDRKPNQHRRTGHIYVVRIDELLVVKRAGRAGESWMLVSDNNEAWESVPWPTEYKLIGRVRWMARTL